MVTYNAHFHARHAQCIRLIRSREPYAVIAGPLPTCHIHPVLLAADVCVQDGQCVVPSSAHCHSVRLTLARHHRLHIYIVQHKSSHHWLNIHVYYTSQVTTDWTYMYTTQVKSLTEFLQHKSSHHWLNIYNTSQVTTDWTHKSSQVKSRQISRHLFHSMEKAFRYRKKILQGGEKISENSIRRWKNLWKHKHSEEKPA
jgi:hypothetical protein